MKLREVNTLPTAAAWLSETTGKLFDVETLLDECAHGRLALCIAIPPEHATLPQKVLHALTANGIAVAKELASKGTLPTVDQVVTETRARLTFSQKADLLIRRLETQLGLYSLHRFQAESLLIHGHIYMHKGIPLDGEEAVEFRSAVRITADMLRVTDDEVQRFAGVSTSAIGAAQESKIRPGDVSRQAASASEEPGSPTSDGASPEPWIARAREHASNIWLRELAHNKRPTKERIANEIAARIWRDDKMVTKYNRRISADYVVRFALSPTANGGWQPPQSE